MWFDDWDNQPPEDEFTRIKRLQAAGGDDRISGLLNNPALAQAAQAIHEQSQPAAKLPAMLGLPGGDERDQMTDDMMPALGARIDSSVGVPAPGYTPSTAGMQTSPFMMTDSFMSKDPVHVLGYSGTSGSSAPSVDNFGPIQRAGIARYNLQMAGMLDDNNRQAQNHAFAMERQKAQLDAEMERTKMMLGPKNDAAQAKEEASTDRAIEALTKMPPGPLRNMILQRHGNRLTPDQIVEAQMIPAAKQTTTSAITGMLPSLIDEGTDQSALGAFLERKGITPDKLAERKRQMETPGLLRGLGMLVTGDESPVKPEQMSEKDAAEYKAINRLLGTVTKDKVAAATDLPSLIKAHMDSGQPGLAQAIKDKGYTKEQLAKEVEAARAGLSWTDSFTGDKRGKYLSLKALLDSMQ